MKVKSGFRLTLKSCNLKQTQNIEFLNVPPQNKKSLVISPKFWKLFKRSASKPWQKMSSWKSINLKRPAALAHPTVVQTQAENKKTRTFLISVFFLLFYNDKKLQLTEILIWEKTLKEIFHETEIRQTKQNHKPEIHEIDWAKR